MAMEKIFIKSCFYLLRIIGYIVLFGQVNQIFFSVPYLEYIGIMSFSNQRALYYIVNLAILILFANCIYKNASNAQTLAI